MLEEFLKILLPRLDKQFESDVNLMHDANRACQADSHLRAIYLSGKADGLSTSAKIIHETHKLFTNQNNEEADVSRTLY